MGYLKESPKSCELLFYLPNHVSYSKSGHVINFHPILNSGLVTRPELETRNPFFGGKSGGLLHVPLALLS